MIALKKILSGGLILFIVVNGFAQNNLGLNLFGDTFQRILLDGQAAYINTATNEIISPQEYLKFTQDTTSLLYIFPNETWDTLKVNPYQGHVLEYPFKLQFLESDYAPPVSGPMVITSHFGKRRQGPHRGIDIDLETGDKVFSILPGKVRFVGYSRGHGHTVVVRHYNGLETVYAHLSKYEVKVNEVVGKGQVIGLGGKTGNARGSHLHMEVRFNGRCINPEYLFEFIDEPIIRSDTMLVTRTWVNPNHHSSYRGSVVEIVTDEQLVAEQ
jgi:murein DD-endopeptidase MepM/ murein hydrolase activator NlpD